LLKSALFVLNQKTLFFATAIALSFCGMAQAQSNTPDNSKYKEIAINFAAYVGEEKFVCGQSYEGVGTRKSTITPKDFRFYVSNIALIDNDGNAIPLKLSQDKQWQYQNTALLDFEDGTSSCDNGTAQINTTVVGRIPEGDYQSLQFTLGVPQNLNHDDAAISPSPLNLTSMWWNWQGGYKFLRVDLETESAIVNVGSNSSHSGQSDTQANEQTSHQTGKQPSIFNNGQGSHKDPHSSSNTQSHSTQTSHHNSNGETTTGHDPETVSSNAYLIHLGSTGCSDSTQNSLFDCANPNRTKVVLEDFDPEDDVVIADLGELLAQSDLTSNQVNTPNGCMSSPEDSDCIPIMQNLNLSTSTSKTGAAQYFFFVE
jgi:uncharacterized repeat protein (TIGR04052 family)